MARVDEQDDSRRRAPAALRPYLRFAKLPPRAAAAARKVLEGNDDFRGRVAEATSEDAVGRAGWLFLERPPGWDGEFAVLVAAAEEAADHARNRKAETAERRRDTAAERAAKRAEEAAAAARDEAAKATAALAEERRARHAARREAADLRKQVRALEAEREAGAAAVANAEALRAELAGMTQDLGRRTAEVKKLRKELDRLQAELPGPSSELAVALADAGDAIRRALDALAPAPEPAASPKTRPARARVADRTIRVPAALPPGIMEESSDAADHLVRVNGVVILVDGYNASQAGWPDQPIAEQRRRLVDALNGLAARTGADVHVVFDGAEGGQTAAVRGAGRRAVRVAFSPPDVEADDVILERIGTIPPHRPVVVASSDRRVQDGARRQGANVLTAGQLLAILR